MKITIRQVDLKDKPFVLNIQDEEIAYSRFFSVEEMTRLADFTNDILIEYYDMEKKNGHLVTESN